MLRNATAGPVQSPVISEEAPEATDLILKQLEHFANEWPTNGTQGNWVGAGVKKDWYEAHLVPVLLGSGRGSRTAELVIV
ncbi:hypothetical protein OHU34_46030 (plasmid) [Streptomyces sp. NBC_00080]|uniref:hypothetical protein n=1 Tax=Streptomyces sp. NBC_00080 TaxID=2975645 RepID=UPI003251DE8D